jgi:glycosyltransferase involved in cell wall biosynthesis
MRRVPVSCFIIAKNESDRIARTIRSVRSFVDEVVVVDSESTDETVRVAVAEGCRVITRRWLGFGGQKRFAEDQCRNDWVFNIDADEVVTPELKQEIIALFESGSPSLPAYGVPVHLVYPGTEKPRPWARDHWYVRLYNRRIVRFRDSALHDTVVAEGHQIGSLCAPIHHYSVRSFADMKQKLNERMWLSVKHGNPHSKAWLMPRLVTEIPMNFVKYYVIRRHFMGGVAGLLYASIQSWYRFLKIYRMWLVKTFGEQVLEAWQQQNEACDRDGLKSFGAWVQALQPARGVHVADQSRLPNVATAA